MKAKIEREADMSNSNHVYSNVPIAPNQRPSGFKRIRSTSGMNLRLVSLSLVSSVIFFNGSAVSDVSASDTQAAASVLIPDTETTILAQAVNTGLQDQGRSTTRSSVNGLRMNRASTQSGSTTPENALLLSHANELMDLDNRDVDAIALRLKEIIKARYEADHLYVNTLAEADALRQQLTEYEGLLRHANEQQELLGAEKLTLQNELDQLLNERDMAHNEINSLSKDMLFDKQQVVGELNAQVAQLNEERQDAQSRADSIAQLLDQRDQRIKDIEDQLASVVAERDEAANRAELSEVMVEEKESLLQDLSTERDNIAGKVDSTEALLAEKESLLQDLRQQFNNVQENNNNAQSEVADYVTAIADKEKTLDGLNGQLAATTTERDQAIEEIERLSQLVNQREDSLAILRNESNGLAAERDATKAEFAEISALVNEKSGIIDELNGKLDKLTNDREEVTIQLASSKSTIDEVNELANNFLQERNTLEDSLNLFKDKASNASGQLAAEKQKHSSAMDKVAQLEADLERLQEEFSALSGERDTLLDDKNHLESISADLNDRLLNQQQELDTHQSELQTSHGTVEDLHSQISALQSERDAGRAAVEALQADLDSVRGELTSSREQSEVMLTATNTEFEAERLNLSESITQKDERVRELDGQLAELTADMENRQQDWQSQASAKDKEILDLRSSIANLETDRKQLNSLKSKGELRLSGIQKKLAGLTKRHDTSTDQLSKLKALNEELEEQLVKSRKALMSVSATGKSQLAALNKKIQDLEASGIDAEEQIKKLNEVSNSVKTNLGSTRSELSRVSKEGSLKAEKLQAQIDALEATNSKLTTKDAKTQRGLTEALSSNRLLTKKLSDSKKEKDATAAELEKLKRNLIKYESDLTIADQKWRDLEATQQLAEENQAAELAEADLLRKELEEELKSSQLEVITVQTARDDNAIPIRLGNADFFAPGSAKLTASGADKLTRLAEIIGTFDDRRIVVEGHTDSVPISARLKHRFESNWELSTARAATAVRHMQINSKLDPQNLSAAGYGPYKQVAPNNTPEGRQQNRRIEVILYPRHEEFTDISSLDE